MIYYENVFRKLNKHRIRYLVAGGVAIVLHGVVRFTADLDLIVDLERENLIKFIRCLEDLGYRPKVPVKALEFADSRKRKEWKEKKEMKVFSFCHSKRHLDLIDVFVEEIIKFSRLEKERVVFKAKGIKIPVVSVRHLEQLKRISGRPEDLADLNSLKELERMKKDERKKT